MGKDQKEKYEEKLEEYVPGWGLKNSCVYYDKRIIFLYRVKVAPFSESQTTMRGMFYGFYKENDSRLFSRLLLTEAFKNYLEDSHYPDLISSGKDVVNLSSLIIIFLESSGSITELGLFCNLDDIDKELLAIVPEHEVEGDKKESFTYLGPLSYLREKVNEKSYTAYPDPVDGKDYSEHLELILNDVKSLTPPNGKEYKFDISNPGHLTFLFTHIISLAMPIRLKETIMRISKLGTNATLQKGIERILFLLGTFSHIEVYEYEGTRYYYTKSSEGSIRLSKNKPDYTVDEVGIKADLLLFISDVARCDDKKRRLALNSIKEMIGEYN